MICLQKQIEDLKMNNLIMVTGGARSGKSTFAEKLVKDMEGQTTYLATALPIDQDMEYRIHRHQSDRNKDWYTIERYKDFKKLKNNIKFKESKNILLDCLTLLLNNQLFDLNKDWDNISNSEIDKIEHYVIEDILDLLELCKDKNLVIVTNEIGLGIVPVNRFTNFYRDILGRINQLVASKANRAFFLVSGIPIQLK